MIIVLTGDNKKIAHHSDGNLNGEMRKIMETPTDDTLESIAEQLLNLNVQVVSVVVSIIAVDYPGKN